MIPIQQAAALLRTELSQSELSGDLKTSDALRLTESLYEIERLLTKDKNKKQLVQ